MKPVDHAWRVLQARAEAQLRGDFADRVVRSSRGPQPETWQHLQAVAAARLRPGFAARVLRAARQIPGVPSLLDQFALCAVTALLCVVAVVFVHSRGVRNESERNLAGWEQLADDIQEIDQF